jgi:hypothetical protein
MNNRNYFEIYYDYSIEEYIEPILKINNIIYNISSFNKVYNSSNNYEMNYIFITKEFKRITNELNLNNKLFGFNIRKIIVI